MTRNRNVDQEKIYQQYAQLGKQIADLSTVKKNKKIFHNKVWELIAKEGIWKLPIPREYDGLGLSWQECTIAIEGLASAYSNFEFLSLLITHVSTIYLILQYGTKSHKEEYLPRLIQGKFGCLLISDSVSKSYYREYQINKYIKNISNVENIGIIVRVNKIGNDIEYYYHDMKDYRQSIFFKNKFIFSENNHTVLCDLFNFQRLLYSTLAANFALHVLGKVKEITQLCSAFVTEQVIKKVQIETRNNLTISQQVLYSSLQ